MNHPHGSAVRRLGPADPSRRAVLRGAAACGALGAVGPLLGACTSSAPSGSAAPADTIKIGVTAALTGTIAATALQFTGYMKRVFDQAGAAGGAGGRKFQLVLMDDGGSGQKALTNARTLVEQEQVFAMSTVGSANTSSILDYLDAKKVPLLFPAAYLESTISPVRKSTFALWAPYDREIAAVAKWGLAGMGPGTAVIVRANLAYLDSAQQAAQDAVAAGGGRVLKTISTAYGQPEWGSTVIELQALRPDYLILLTTATDSGRLWKEMVVQGYRPGRATLGINTIADQAFLDTAGTVADRSTFGAVPATVVPSDPAADPIRALWPGNTLGLFGLEGALAAAVIVEAVHRLGKNVSREAMVDLLGTGFQSYKTAYSSAIASAADHLMARQMAVATVQGGRFVPADGGLISV